MELGTILIKLRTMKGYSQEAIAEEIGVSYQTYARYESEKNEMKVSALQAVSAFYEMTVDQLINYDPKEPYPQHPNKVFEKKMVDYEKSSIEKDHKISILMEQKLSLEKNIKSLKGTVDDKNYILELLEEKVKGITGESDSTHFGVQRIGS